MKSEIDYTAICLDFSHQSLRQFPRDILNCRNLRMLCLEGNELECIPGELFTKIERLTWLDLRNNKIKVIPCTIGACKYLETLLIQDNDIEYLPMELGLVPNLKSLHLSGNPLKYPKPEVLQLGICGIVQFLKAEYDSLFHTKGSQVENLHQIQEKCKDAQTIKNVSNDRSVSRAKKSNTKRLFDSLFATEIKKTLNVKPIKFYNSDLNKKEKVKELKGNSLTIKQDRGDSQEIESGADASLINEITTSSRTKKKHFPVNNSDRYLQRSSVQRNDLKAQENALRQYWTEQLRDLLQQQATIIQRRKTIESLKEWRQQVDKFQTLSATKDNQTTSPPFDIDPEFLKMPNRLDLQLQNSTTTKKKPRVHARTKQKIDFNKQINEIIQSIRLLETLNNVPLTPFKEQQLLEAEIKKLNKIQKTINDLKVANNAFQLI